MDYTTNTEVGGCSCCRPYEKILQWKAGKLDDDSARLPVADGWQVVSVGVGGFNQDLYVVNKP